MTEIGRIGVRWLLLGVLAAVHTLFSASEAVTRHVPSEYPTIQNGVDASSFGDTVLVAPGTYADFEVRILDGFSWTSCAFMKDGVVLKSQQGPSVTTIDIIDMKGQFQPSAIISWQLPSDKTVVDGFTIEGRERGLGALILFCEGMSLRDCVFQNFDGGPTTGGAVVVDGNGSISGCEFTNCKANAAGAIWHTEGNLKLTGSTFRECGNLAVSSENTSAALVADCQFINNWNTSGVGGGALIGSSASLTITGCLFQGNSNTEADGGGLSASGMPLTIERCVFIDNTASGSNGRGGGLDALGFPLLIRNNTFVGNGAPQGASVDMNYGTFENNIVVSSVNGAAILAEADLVSNCNVFWSNLEGVGYVLAPTDRQVDPLFCDQGVFDLTLRKGSPCLPEDPLGCGLIGAFEQGCGTIAIKSQSWGSIKTRYR